MKVLLLGTGAANGLPAAFCTCATCTDARATGSVRATTAALVDERILIDAGPGVVTGVGRSGTHLRDLRHILVTHAHPDHLDPALLLWLAWDPPPHEMHLWGPDSVLVACRDWIGPSARIVTHRVEAGSTVDLPTDVGTWRLDVLPAAHAGPSGPVDAIAADAVLFALTAPSGRRLLYGTDTGPLPDQTLTALRGADLDLVLIEDTFGDRTDHGTGHLDLRTLPEQIARLRRVGAVTARTRILAVHIGHHNPSAERLRARLGQWGVDLPADLDLITVDDGAGGHGAAAQTAPQRHLVLGGTASGKSAHAESLLAARAEVTYLAPMTIDHDAEWRARVARHRAHRPASWQTLETDRIAPVIADAGPQSAVLVDALTTWLTAVLDRTCGPEWDGLDAHELTDVADAAIEEVCDALRVTRGTIVLVSDEVGLGGHAPTAAGRVFADLLGRVNTRVARECDDVTLVVAGHPLALTPMRSPT